MAGLTLPVTLAAAAACGLLNIWLAWRVGQIRRAERISIGDGGNAALTARMRAHLNFAEFAPLVLILLGLVEAARGTHPLLWATAALFVLARIAHPIGMDGWIAGRGFGIVATLAVTLGLAIYAIVILATTGMPGWSAELPPATV